MAGHYSFPITHLPTHQIFISSYTTHGRTMLPPKQPYTKPRDIYQFLYHAWKNNAHYKATIYQNTRHLSGPIPRMEGQCSLPSNHIPNHETFISSYNTHGRTMHPPKQPSPNPRDIYQFLFLVWQATTPSLLPISQLIRSLSVPIPRMEGQCSLPSNHIPNQETFISSYTTHGRTMLTTKQPYTKTQDIYQVLYHAWKDNAPSQATIYQTTRHLSVPITRMEGQCTLPSNHLPTQEIFISSYSSYGRPLLLPYYPSPNSSDLYQFLYHAWKDNAPSQATIYQTKRHLSVPIPRMEEQCSLQSNHIPKHKTFIRSYTTHGRTMLPPKQPYTKPRDIYQFL